MDKKSDAADSKYKVKFDYEQTKPKHPKMIGRTVLLPPKEERIENNENKNQHSYCIF